MKQNNGKRKFDSTIELVSANGSTSSLSSSSTSMTLNDNEGIQIPVLNTFSISSPSTYPINSIEAAQQSSISFGLNQETNPELQKKQALLTQIINLNVRRIIEHAFSFDLDAINALKEEGYLIDEKEKSNYTAGLILARSGFKDEAEFLREQGANKHYIAMGAAEGGQFTYLKFLYDLGAYKHMVARGLARGGFTTEAEVLRKKGVDIDGIAEGAAEGKQDEYVKFLIQRGANISFIARGYARIGDWGKVEELKNLGAFQALIMEGAAESGLLNRNESFANCYDYIAGAIAKRGDIKYAISLIGKGKADVEYVLIGIGEGGHIKDETAIALMDSYIGAKISVAQGAAKGGLRGYAEFIRNDALEGINCIVNGASTGQDYEYVDFLRELGASIKEIFKGALEEWHKQDVISIVQNYQVPINQCMKNWVFKDRFKFLFNDRFELMKLIVNSKDDLQEYNLQEISQFMVVTFINEVKNIMQITQLSMADAYCYYTEENAINNGTRTMLSNFAEVLLDSSSSNTINILPPVLQSIIGAYAAEHPEPGQKYHEVSEKAITPVIGKWQTYIKSKDQAITPLERN